MHAARESVVRHQLLALIDASPLSDRKISMLACGSPDTIRNIRRGVSPHAHTLEKLCRVLGMELRLERRSEYDAAAAKNTQPPTRFHATAMLQLRSWSCWNRDDALSGPQPPESAPAPEHCGDPHAFYARLPPGRLEPAGIGAEDVCLVSPCAALRPDTRGWFRKRNGSETAGWIAAMDAGGFTVAGWTAGKGNGTATPIHERLSRDEIGDRGAITAVYEALPAPGASLGPKAPWEPGPAATLWRIATLENNTRLAAMLEEIEQNEARIRKVGDLIQGRIASRAISPREGVIIVTALDHRIRQVLRRMESEAAAEIPVISVRTRGQPNHEKRRHGSSANGPTR